MEAVDDDGYEQCFALRCKLNKLTSGIGCISIDFMLEFMNFFPVIALCPSSSVKSG